MRAALLLVVVLVACGKTPAERIERARDAVYNKRPQQALKEYRLAIDGAEGEDSAEAHRFLARALLGAADVYYLELRDVRQAVPLYRELLTKAPESNEALAAHMALAEILKVHYRDLRGAITELTAVVARNPPQTPELRYQVAKLYFELNDFLQSSLEAGRVVDQFPQSPDADDALLLQGQALAMVEGRRAEAIKALESLPVRFPRSELAPHALFELGKLLADSGENSEAIAIWVKALQAHPNPALVQAAITRVRRRITHTTPTAIGEKAVAFDHSPHVRVAAHRTSVEAAGGTAEEAAHEYGD
jgi:tetratricopeptide (TPR) repeat protein